MLHHGGMREVEQITVRRIVKARHTMVAAPRGIREVEQITVRYTMVAAPRGDEGGRADHG